MTENLGGLFDATPVVIAVGDRVSARTIWGPEVGTVVEIGEIGPELRMARIQTEGERGEILISLPRLTKL